MAEQEEVESLLWYCVLYRGIFSCNVLESILSFCFRRDGHVEFPHRSDSLVRCPIELCSPLLGGGAKGVRLFNGRVVDYSPLLQQYCVCIETGLLYYSTRAEVDRVAGGEADIEQLLGFPHGITPIRLGLWVCPKYRPAHILRMPKQTVTASLQSATRTLYAKLKSTLQGSTKLLYYRLEWGSATRERYVVVINHRVYHYQLDVKCHLEKEKYFYSSVFPEIFNGASSYIKWIIPEQYHFHINHFEHYDEYITLRSDSFVGRTSDCKGYLSPGSGHPHSWAVILSFVEVYTSVQVRCAQVLAQSDTMKSLQHQNSYSMGHFNLYNYVSALAMLRKRGLFDDTTYSMLLNIDYPSAFRTLNDNCLTTLLNNTLTSRNILVHGGEFKVVSWRYASLGPALVDYVFLLAESLDTGEVGFERRLADIADLMKSNNITQYHNMPYLMLLAALQVFAFDLQNRFTSYKFSNCFVRSSRSLRHKLGKMKRTKCSISGRESSKYDAVYHRDDVRDVERVGKILGLISRLSSCFRHLIPTKTNYKFSVNPVTLQQLIKQYSWPFLFIDTNNVYHKFIRCKAFVRGAGHPAVFSAGLSDLYLITTNGERTSLVEELLILLMSSKVCPSCKPPAITHEGRESLSYIPCYTNQFYYDKQTS